MYVSVLLAIICSPIVLSLGFRGRDFRFTLTEAIFVLLLPLIIFSVRKRSTRWAHVSLFFVFVLLIVMSSAQHFDAQGVIRIFQLLLAVATPGIMGFLIADDPGLLKRVHFGLAIASLITFFIAIAQLIAGAPLFFISGGLPNNQVFCLFQVITAPFLFYTISTTNLIKSFGLRLFCALLVLVLAAMFFGDLGLFVSLIIAVLVVMTQGSLFSRVWRYSSVLVLIVAWGIFHPVALKDFFTLSEHRDVAAAYQRSDWLGNTRKDAMAGSITIGPGSIKAEFLPLNTGIPPVVPQGRDHTILKQRYAEWFAAAVMASKNPLLGVGLGRYQMSIGEYYRPMPKLNTSKPDTQNGWLVAASTIGIPATLLLLLMIGGALYSTPLAKGSTKEVEPFSIALSGSLSGMLIAGFWGPFWQTGILVPWFVLVGCSMRVFPVWQNLANFAGVLGQYRRELIVVAILLFVPILINSIIGERRTSTNIFYHWHEAEKVESIIEPMLLQQDNSASGHGILNLPDGAGTGWRNEAGGEAVYKFSLAASTNATLWARTKWTDGCGNAFYLSANEAKPVILGNDSTFNTWHWVRVPSLQLRKGENTLKFSNREDGVKLDKWLITNDLEFEPQGTWEAVYTSDFRQDNLQGWTAIENQKWEHNLSSDYPLSPKGKQSNFLLMDAEPRGDFSLACEYNGKTADAVARIILFYQDPTDYYDIELGANVVSLARTRTGIRTVLQENRSMSSNRSGNRLDVTYRAGKISVRLEGRERISSMEKHLPVGKFGLGGHGIGFRRCELRPLESISISKKFDDFSPSKIYKFGDVNWANYKVILVARENYTDGLSVALSSDQSRGVSLLRKESQWYLGRKNDKARKGKAVSSTLQNVKVELRCLESQISLLVNDQQLVDIPPEYGTMFSGMVFADPSQIVELDIRPINRFYDGFGGCDGGNFGSWKIIGGNWTIVAETNDPLLDSLLQSSKDRAKALTGDFFWTNYSVKVLMRSTMFAMSGLIFNYKDEANYCSFKWVPMATNTRELGSWQLVEIIDGKVNLMAQKEGIIELDRWYELSVFPHQNRLYASVDGIEMISSPLPTSLAGRAGLICDENAGVYFDNFEAEFQD